MYKKYIKRWIDIIVATFLIFLTLPLTLLVSIILYFLNKGSVFFYQERTGLHAKPFKIIKFKTMTDEKDSNGKLLPDFKRITKVGAFLRKTSIDELPQLINVLRGDMSLIGPRPLLPKYVPLYSKEQFRRHLVRPGITGWAQVNGRNEISWTKRFELDVYYVDHISLALDLKIILMTIIKVIKREGINQNDERPMQPFNGKN